MEVSYRCIECSHPFGVAIPDRAPAPRPEDYPRQRCPRCGAAGALAYYLDHARDETGEFSWEGCYRRWSNCPNAYACSLHWQYAPECEAGQVMQKCFVSLHAQLELILDLLPAPKPKRVRRAKPKAGDNERP